MKITHIMVINKAGHANLGGSDPDDRWSRDSTATFNNITGIEVSDRFSDLSVDFDVDFDKTYFLLWADYDTGDSFGRDEGMAEYVALYEDFYFAETQRNILENTEGYTAEIMLTPEKPVKFHIPWKGYFENLNEINITPVRRKK